MFTVRKATIGDSERIARIEEENFSDPWSKKNIEDFILSGHTLSLVILDDHDEVKGHLLSTYAGEGFPEGGESEIDTFAVSDDIKGKGAGTLLLKEYFKVLSELNVRKTALEVRVSNIAAIKSYEKFGFATVNKRKDFYTDPLEDAYIMIREEKEKDA